MARQLRFQYPGAVYHVMARGDGGKQLSLLGRKTMSHSGIGWNRFVAATGGGFTRGF